MLIPTGLSKKEKRAYVKRYTHQLDPKKVNVGLKAGLQPPGGYKRILAGLIEKFNVADEEAVDASKTVDAANEAFLIADKAFAKVKKAGDDLKTVQTVVDNAIKSVEAAELIVENTAEAAGAILREIAIVEEKLNVKTE